MRTILQSQAAECTLACLAMVADFHGLRFDLADLRRRFAVSLKGSNMKQLFSQASSLGFQARALQLDLDELAQLKLPCVLHWDLNHAVVLNPDFPLDAPASLLGCQRASFGHFYPSSSSIAELSSFSVGTKLPQN